MTCQFKCLTHFSFLPGAFIFALMFFTGLAGSVYGQQADVSLEALLAEERSFYYSDNPGTGPQKKGDVGDGKDLQFRPPPKPVSLKNVSEKAQLQRLAFYEDLKVNLARIDKNDLNPSQRLNYDLFGYYLNRQTVFLKHRAWRQPLFSDSGFHTSITRVWRNYPLKTKADSEAYLLWLQDIPRHFSQHIANMRLGLKENFTMPQIVLKGLLPSFRAVTSVPVEKSSFVTEIDRAQIWLGDDFASIKDQIVKTVNDLVYPAYANLADFMENDYLPSASTAISISEMTAGDKYYKDSVRFYTTLDVTPDEVHEIGLAEVSRIRSEMEKVITSAGFKGDFKDFITFLREDPQFYVETGDELVQIASYIAKKIDAKMPSLFKKLPRQPYGVEAVPADLAPNYTTGRYVGAPIDSKRAGTYWVNTFALNKRPLYALPSLTLHEAVPGHHHQIALSKELTDVPEFRLELYPHAFGEGWGLYSEKLGLDIGIYQTPYEHFGRLSYEMWRAVRLVVDTGIHSKGWSREQAIRLMEDNTALSTLNVRIEIDRYIAWPGQALAYKMGELTFLKLRDRARQILGANFDLRDFHDALLAEGGMPLGLLEQRMEQWIQDRLSKVSIDAAP